MTVCAKNDYVLYVAEEAVSTMLGDYVGLVSDNLRNLLEIEMFNELFVDSDNLDTSETVQAYIFDSLLRISDMFSNRQFAQVKNIKSIFKEAILTYPGYHELTIDIDNMTFDGVMSGDQVHGCVRFRFLGVLYAIVENIAANDFQSNVVLGDMLDELDEYTQRYLDSFYI